MAYDNNDNHYGDSESRYGRNPNNSNGEGRNNDSIYSKRVKAGKRRTYFFDVRATRGNDYFITITESKKRFEDGTYERHKMFLYKEDFHKFVAALQETVNYVKTDLMPDFDFDSFNHEYDEDGGYQYRPAAEGQPVYESQETTPEAVTEATEILSAPVAESYTNDSEVDGWKA